MFVYRVYLGLYLILVSCLYNVHSYYTTLTHNGPVVLGATITFRAELFDAGGGKPRGTFRFSWRDNAIPQHISDEDETFLYEAVFNPNTDIGCYCDDYDIMTYELRMSVSTVPWEQLVEFEGHETVSVWNVTYAADTYGPGMYEVQVAVDKSSIFYWPLTTQRAYFNLTAALNGRIAIHQGVISRNSFVSNVKEVNHSIQLKETDADFILRNATSILTYWFVDCVYYGQTSDYNFQINYTDAMKTHIVEALVIASYDPVTTTTEVPTTVPSTNITTTMAAPASNVTTTASTTTTTTTATSTTTASSPATVVVQTTTESLADAIVPNSTEIVPTNSSVMMPFVCLNTSVIPADPKKTYGYFVKKIQVKAPISKVSVEGTNWLQHGDLLKLHISWTGSPDYTYCKKEYFGIYNVTGKEDCGSKKVPVLNNTVELKHYFPIPGTYTYVIILENDVSKNVTQVGINVYEVTKQAQLSVIVVPVACSLLAVILIVFGVAYYIQSRNTYTIEVADFNFGQRDNMEYKTFSERLQEVFQGHGFTCPEVGKSDNTWGPGARNDYGRMN